MGLIDRVRRGSDASSHSKEGSGESSGSFGSPSGGEGSGGNGASPNDTEVLDKEEGNLLMSMISQREFSSSFGLERLTTGKTC